MAHTSAPRTGAAVCRRDRMFKFERKSLAMPVAVVAAIIMMCAACFAFMGTAEAKTFPDQGITEDLQGTTIEMAPGFSYTYTIEFDSTLNEGVEVDDIVNTLPEGTQTTITKGVSGDTWGTLKVVLDSDCAAGTYDLVLKATHAESEQTAYQYIIFDVKNGVTITPTEIQLGKVIQNDNFSQEFVVTAGYGNIQSVEVSTAAFDVSGQQPSVDGTQQSVTFTVTGTPTEIGAKTITISGDTTNNETFTKTYDFTVYSEFEGTYTEETIGTTDGTTDSSAAETVPSDLQATTTWSAQIPEQYQSSVSINAQTGVVTVTGGAYIDIDLTVTATDSTTEQTKTKVVHIENEASDAAISLSGDSAFVENILYTYQGNATAKALTATANKEAGQFSGIASWDITESTGVSIDNGNISVLGTDLTASTGTQITVTATTEFGKVLTTQFSITVEGLLSVSSGETVKLVNVSPENTKTVTFTAAAENAVLSYSEQNSNELELTADLNEEGKQVTFTSSTAAQHYTYTLHVSTLGGQSDDIEYTVNTYADLSFSSAPSNGIVAIAM